MHAHAHASASFLELYPPRVNSSRPLIHTPGPPPHTHTNASSHRQTPPTVQIISTSFRRDAVYCESHIAPLLDELKYNINLKMHYIGDKQVRAGG